MAVAAVKLAQDNPCKGPHSAPAIILLSVRWYLRYALTSLPDRAAVSAGADRRTSAVVYRRPSSRAIRAPPGPSRAGFCGSLRADLAIARLSKGGPRTSSRYRSYTRRDPVR